MEKTWRWFGPNDPITLDMLRQIGVEGIVSALHDVPNGDVWEIENISRRKAYIESHGLRWSVVESLPVCEAVKYGGAERDRLIENYKNSLANLGRCGIKTVCYNFMPVIDWIRTDLQHPWADGTTSLYFDRRVSPTSTFTFSNAQEQKKIIPIRYSRKSKRWVKSSARKRKTTSSRQSS